MATERTTRNLEDWVEVGPLAELSAEKIRVVAAGRSRIAVVVAGDQVFAVDNRCPHMGFPLERGSVADGILTCHWHQARFDLASGCTFDLFADDVPAYDTRVEDGVVYVSTRPRHAQNAEYHGERLRRGIEQNVPLVQAKSLLGLLEVDAFDRVVAEAAAYAAKNISGFSEGLEEKGSARPPIYETGPATHASRWQLEEISTLRKTHLPCRIIS